MDFNTHVLHGLYRRAGRMESWTCQHSPIAAVAAAVASAADSAVPAAVLQYPVEQPTAVWVLASFMGGQGQQRQG